MNRKHTTTSSKHFTSGEGKQVLAMSLIFPHLHTSTTSNSAKTLKLMLLVEQAPWAAESLSPPVPSVRRTDCILCTLRTQTSIGSELVDNSRRHTALHFVDNHQIKESIATNNDLFRTTNTCRRSTCRSLPLEKTTTKHSITFHPSK